MDIGSIPVRASRINIHTDLNNNVVVASLEMIGRAYQEIYYLQTVLDRLCSFVG